MSFQIDIASEAAFKTEVLDIPSTLQVVEVYQPWSGPCKAIQSTFKKLYYEYGGDRPLKFYTVASDKLPFLKEYNGHCQPVFLFFKDGKQVEKVVGVQAPILTSHIVGLSAPKAAAAS